MVIRPGQRAFLDLLRQIGAQIAAEDLGESEFDLHVSASQLKATRVAGPRAAKVADQIALLAVLATQTQGTTVIRDIEDMPHVEHLCAALRSLDARIGQFPEGLVIKGGFPLQGGQLDGKGDPNLTMAFAVAGLLAEGELTIQGSDCLTPIWPDFLRPYNLFEEIEDERNFSALCVLGCDVVWRPSRHPFALQRIVARIHGDCQLFH